MRRVLQRLKQSEFAFLLGVTTLQAAVIAGPFIATGSFYNDALEAYELFYDNLDSLNRYGEPAWWRPHVNWGTPSYFVGLLGAPNLGKPGFVSMGLVAWLLGRLGIPLPSVYPLYLFYCGVLIPFLLLLGVWLVARETLQSRVAVRYTLAVAAFSPAVLFNLREPGVTENTAYGLMCTAAYLRFVADPGIKRFWVLCAAALLVAVAAGFPSMVSSVPMLSIVVGASILLSGRARSALRTVHPGHATAAIFLLLTAASPSALAYVQQHHQVVQATVSSLGDSFGEIRAGNPAQPRSPGAGGSDRPDPAGSPSQYRVLSLDEENGFGTRYLGVLAVPLAATGLALGLRRLRLSPTVIPVLVGAVLVLLVWRPLLAPLLLGLPTTVARDQLGDRLYQGFAFLVPLLAAGFGLEAAEGRRPMLRWLIVVLIGSSLLALPIFLRSSEPAPTVGGFLAFMAGCFTLVLTWSLRLPERSRSHLLGFGLIALTLLDVSTAAFWYVRPVLHAPSLVVGTGLEGGIGSPGSHVDVTTERAAHQATAALTDAGVDVGRLPFVRGFCAAHDYDRSSAAREAGVGSAARSLALPEQLRGTATLAPFFSAPPNGDCKVDVEAVGNGYNAFQISVNTTRPALVFVRDSWSAGWTASVNGSTSEVYPALGAFKAFAVPAGASIAQLRFSPPFLGAALLSSYALLVAVAIGAVACPRGERGADG